MMAELAQTESFPKLERLFEENVAALGLQGQTLERVRATTPGASVVHADDGTPLLRSGERVLGSPLGAETLRQQVTAQAEDGVVVLLGLGTGHVARAVRSLTDSPIVAFEPEPSLLRTVLEHGPTDLGGVHVVCTLHDLGQAWPLLARHRAKATLIRSPGYAEAYPELAARLASTVEQLVQRVSINENTHLARARTWMEDILANLELLGEAPCFLGLAGRYRGVPAFIVGSGPSLNGNGAQLGEAASKGIVFAVNSSARALAGHGVEPQVVACIESIDVSARLASLPFIDRVVRAFSVAAHPRVLRTGAGPLLPIYEGLPEISKPLEPLLGAPGLPVCGSVTTAVFSLAERLGCSPIVVVGQDLAYTGGRPYADGTGYETSRARVSRDTASIDLEWNDEVHAAHGEAAGRMHDKELLLEVERWGGGEPVPTGASFNAIRAWLEAAAEILSATRPEIRLVNATEGGARIRGFDEMRLADLLHQLPARVVTAQSIADEARRTIDRPTEADLSAWCRDQAKGARAVRIAARRARELAEHAGSAIRGDDPTTVSRAFDALDEAERVLRNAVKSAPMVETWTLAEVHEAMSDGGARHGEEGARSQAAAAVRRETAIARAVERSTRALERRLERAALRPKERPAAHQPGRNGSWRSESTPTSSR